MEPEYLSSVRPHGGNSGLKLPKLAPAISLSKKWPWGGGIPSWDPATERELVCGSGKTEHDLHDFIYFASANQFRRWVPILPPHIYISEQNASRCSTIARSDSAQLGCVLASRWIILVHGDLSIHPRIGRGLWMEAAWRHRGDVSWLKCGFGTLGATVQTN